MSRGAVKGIEGKSKVFSGFDPTKFLRARADLVLGMSRFKPGAFGNCDVNQKGRILKRLETFQKCGKVHPELLHHWRGWRMVDNELRATLSKFSLPMIAEWRDRLAHKGFHQADNDIVAIYGKSLWRHFRHFFRSPQVYRCPDPSRRLQRHPVQVNSRRPVLFSACRAIYPTAFISDIALQPFSARHLSELLVAELSLAG